MPALLDTHCHIDRYNDPLGVLKAAEAAGVVTVAVTELPSDYQRLALRLGKRTFVRVALGLHPLRAAAASPLEMALFTRLLDRVDYVGEVGLDGSRDGRPSLRAQIKVFEHLLSQPRIKAKVLTVHSRGAEAETIERLGQAGVTAILHWYGGALKAHRPWARRRPVVLRQCSDAALTERAAHRRSASRDRVVTETDGPFAKVGGRPSEPKDVPSIVAGLARHLKEAPEEARARIHQNMVRIAAVAACATPSP